MDYAYKEKNEYVWPAAMQSRFNNVRAWHTLTDEQRAKHNWYPVRYINREYDSVLQERTLVSAELVGTEFLVTYSIRDLMAEEHFTIKQEAIRNDFMASLSPSVEALDIQWNSGMNSSVAIDGAARIAESAGATEVTIHSFDNRSHVLSLAQAIQVAVAIGIDYQQKFKVKQNRMVALAEIDLTASNAIEQIAAI